MSNTIWKYDFAICDGEQIVSMPRDAELLHVEAQAGLLVLWAKVVPERKYEQRRFVVVGTGHRFDSGLTYIGTAQIPPFVWHLLEASHDQP